jgi:DegV family protein with EDD domain
MNVRIITDSAADLLQEEAMQKKVTIIAQPVVFQGETEEVKEVELFWKKLIAGGVAQTSQPSTEVFEREFLKAKEAGEALVCIFISSELSGTYSSAKVVKERIGYDEIYLIDAKSAAASVAEKMLVLEACKLRDQGLSAKEITEKIEKLKGHVRLFACIDTLKYLARGGRLSHATALMGSILNIKPIVTFSEDGKVAIYNKAIGMALAMKKLSDKILSEKISPDYPLIPIYAAKSDNCQKFVAKLHEKGLKMENTEMMGIGATIGSHIGPNAFGLVYVVK